MSCLMNTTSKAIKDMKYNYVGLFPFWFNEKLLHFLKSISSLFLNIWKQFLKLVDKSLFQHDLWKYTVRKPKKKKLLILLLICKNSKYPIRYFLWCNKTLPGTIWLQAYWEPFWASGMECFCSNNKHHQTVRWMCRKFCLGCLKRFRYKTRCAKKNSWRCYAKYKSTWSLFRNILMMLTCVWLQHKVRKFMN